MIRRRALPLALVAIAMAGCALQAPPKSDEIRSQSLPNVAIPPAYTAVGGAPGAVNDGWLARFADPQLDGLVAKALVTMDDDKRAELLRQSITRLLELNAFLPLHFESTLWAFKADIAYAGRADQYTFAMNAKPAKK